MAHKKDLLESFLPVVRYYGLKTEKAVTLGSTLAVTGVATFTAAPVFSGGLGSSGATTITSTSANALAVGANGATNPVLQVDANTASVATGLKVTGAADGGRLALSVISSNTNEGLNIDAKGSGSITIGNVSTGNINLIRAVSASLTVSSVGVMVPLSGSSATAGGAVAIRIGTGASGFLNVCGGSGAPTLSAPQGSLYLRTDGSSTSTRAYINTDAGTTWTAITTAA